ncbi:MAG: hypothetical protein AAFN77_01755 [Planctomycetota bacterium]
MCPTNQRVQFFIALRFVFLIVGIFSFCPAVQAQGKLGGIRNATRAPEPKPAVTRPAPKKQTPKQTSTPRRSQAQAKPTRQRSAEKTDSHVQAHVSVSQRPKRTQPQRTAPAAVSNSGGKLNAVRDAVHDANHRHSQPHRPAPTVRNHRHRVPDYHRHQPRHIPRSRGCFPQPVVIAPVSTVFVPEPVYQAPRVIIQETYPVVPALTPAPVVSVQPNTNYSQPQPAVTYVEPQPEVTYVEPMVESFEQPVELAPGLSTVGYDWFDADSRLWASIGSDFDGLTFGSLGLTAQQARGLGLDLSVSTIRESGTALRDHLWLGDVNLMYQILRRQRLNSALGIGVNWMGDRYGGAAGLNLTASLELKLGQRWSLRGEGDVGTLGDADFLHGKVSLQRRFESAEWSLGVEHYDIGGAEIESVFTGIGIRF